MSLQDEKFWHAALDLRDKRSLVYTAMSKHYFCYRVLVSNFVLEKQLVPLNPFLNFDFGFFGLKDKKTVVEANNNIIRMSDFVWVFGPVSDGVLAELIIANELGKKIRFFSIASDWGIMEVDAKHVEFEEPRLIKSYKELFIYSD